jgi:3-methyladenine DNA glycosylase AlkD
VNKEKQKMSKITHLKKELQNLADKKQAEILQRFFKTGRGQYGEGDKFLGIKVPVQRKIAKKYKQLNVDEIRRLLGSKIHEHRLIALFILIYQYNSGDEDIKRRIYKLYLDNTKHINNWDLVDLSAPNIVGKFLLNKDRKLLYLLAKSKNLWERRVAVLATFEFIKNNESEDTFAIAEILLKDTHDLLHKAVGWMLREVGKRIAPEKEEAFLQKHYKEMPRTMLRYAIERFDEEKRKKYLDDKI